MAHWQQMGFVEEVGALFPQFFRGVRVLEIGSLDINGSVRSFFTGCDYIGLDVSPGRGVDVVCQGQDYDAPDGSFDCVLSCEVMEHNPHWRETFANMIRLCRPGGLVIMTCATRGRAEHGTTRSSPDSSPLTIGKGWEYYRNLEARHFEAALDLRRDFSLHRFFRGLDSNDLYFAGFRAGAEPPAGAEAGLAQLARRYWVRNATRPKAVRNAILLTLLGESLFCRIRGGIPPRPAD